MKKAIKIGIISLLSLCVIVVSALFFQLDIAMLFMKGDRGNITNYEVYGEVHTSGLSSDIYLSVDGNKIKAKIAGANVYIEDVGNKKYIYTPSLFGGYTKIILTEENDQTVFVDLVEDFEREDFVFKSIGYYEMTEEKCKEEGILGGSIKFQTNGILLDIQYSQNLSYSIRLYNFNKAKVSLPK